MSDGWLPNTEHLPHTMCGNSYPASGGKRVTIHTTEGKVGSLDSVLRYWDLKDAQGVLTVPQFTLDWSLKRTAQHGSIFQPACSLEGCNAVSTNGVPNVQVELVGQAESTHLWPESALAYIAEWMVDVREAGFDFPLVSTVTFYGLDAGFTLASYNAPQRLSYAAWTAYQGVLGHTHVPCNAHWDPGKLNVQRILEMARSGGQPTPSPPLPPKEEIDMSAEANIMAALANLSAQVNKNDTDTRLMEGMVAVKTANSPAQFLIISKAGTAVGFAKLHLSGEAKEALVAQGVLQAAPAELAADGHLNDFKTLTGSAASWLDSLPDF